MRFGAIVNSARGGGLRGPPLGDRVNQLSHLNKFNPFKHLNHSNPSDHFNQSAIIAILYPTMIIAIKAITFKLVCTASASALSGLFFMFGICISLTGCLILQVGSKADFVMANTHFMQTKILHKGN